MSESSTLARPYARAAFSLAHAGGTQADWSTALAFAAQAAADPKVSAMLGHPALAEADAVALLSPPDDTAPGAREGFGSFLGVLAANRRLPLLPEIAALYADLRAEQEQVVRARITSAVALGDDELATLRAALKRRFGREVEIDTAVDAALIGGAVIDTGDAVIDGSVRGKLARMQSLLAD